MINLILAILLFIIVLTIKYIFNCKTENKELEETNNKLAGLELQQMSDYRRESVTDNLTEKINRLKETINHHKKVSNTCFICGTICSCFLLILSFIAIVPTGYTGIKTTFGKVENDTVSSGINFVLPWQNIVLMDNRTQKVQIDTQAFSSDIQQVDIKMSVNYSIDKKTAQILYQTVGINYYENVMYPRIQENTKAVFSQYTAESLIEKRNELSKQIAIGTATDMERYGVIISSISIEDIDFTDAFTDAVEAKQVAAQKKLTAETEQAQKTMEQQAAAERAIIEEKAKAEQAVIAAQADLEVVQIQAEASLYAGQREAEMNLRIAEALTDDLLSYYWIKQWDGILPSTMLGNNPSIMLTLDNTGN